MVTVLKKAHDISEVYTGKIVDESYIYIKGS